MRGPADGLPVFFNVRGKGPLSDAGVAALPLEPLEPGGLKLSDLRSRDSSARFLSWNHSKAPNVDISLPF